MLEPTGRRVLVKPFEHEVESSVGGIWIPDTAKGEKQMGEVVAAGPLATFARPGDIVVYASKAGSRIEDKLVLNDDCIMARKRV